MHARARHLSILVLLATLACGKQGATETPTEPTADPGKGSTTQIANPASVNCIDKGGTLEIVDTPAGQQGVCTLKDGTKCEEWAYMRGECPAAEGAPQTSAERPPRSSRSARPPRARFMPANDSGQRLARLGKSCAVTRRARVGQRIPP